MRKIILTIAALGSLITGAPAPAEAAPASQAVLATILALPDGSLAETVQYGGYERERRFRARQAARRREFRRRQAARRAYRY